MLGFAFSHFSIQSGERLLLPTAAGLSVNEASGWAMVSVRGAEDWFSSLLGPDEDRLGRDGTRWTWNIYLRRGHSPLPGAGCRQQGLGCAGIELVHAAPLQPHLLHLPSSTKHSPSCWWATERQELSWRTTKSRGRQPEGKPAQPSPLQHCLSLVSPFPCPQLAQACLKVAE